MSGMLTMEERQRTSSILLSEYMNQWLEHKKSSIAQATYRSYENIINGRTKRFFDPIGVTHIDTDAAARGGLSGLSCGRRRQRQHAVPGISTVLNQVLKQAVRKDHIDRSPLDKVDHPKKNKFHPSFYTKEEALHLLEISRDDPLLYSHLARRVLRHAPQ
jgi:integrase